MSNFKYGFWKYLQGCLSLTLLLVSCVVSENQSISTLTDATATFTHAVTKVSTLEGEILDGQTPPVENADIQTTEVAQLANNTTPTSLATNTLIPATEQTSSQTSSNFEGQQNLLQTMLNDPDCVLPCFMGFTPSKTSLEQVKMQLSPLATDVYFNQASENVSALTFLFSDSDLVSHDGPYHQGFIFRDETLWEINTALIEGELFSIQTIFRQYGAAEEIWISTVDYAGFRDDKDFLFDLIMFYPDNGFFLSFGMDAKLTDEGTGMMACTKHVLQSHIRIWEPNEWDPKGVKTILDRANDNTRSTFSSLRFAGLDEVWSGKSYEQPIEDVTDFSAAALYEAVLDSEDSVCIKTLFEHWPPYSGE